MLRVFVNDESLELADGMTVLDLLGHLDLVPRGIAVELNGGLVPPSELAERILRDGDELELVRVVGGG